jgi:hypothetical protein
MRAPPGAGREAAPDETPRASSQNLVRTTGLNVTALKIGDRVVTLPTVWPRRYANRTGHVAALNARDDEIGLRLGQPSSHTSAIWFRPSELTVAVGQAPSGALGDSASAVRVSSSP